MPQDSNSKLATLLLKHLYPPHGPVVRVCRMSSCPRGYTPVTARTGECFYLHALALERFASLGELRQAMGH